METNTKYTSKNKPKVEGFYLVKVEDYSESGYLVAEWNHGAFISEINGEDVSDYVTYFSKRLKR